MYESKIEKIAPLIAELIAVKIQLNSPPRVWLTILTSRENNIALLCTVKNTAEYE